MQVAPDSLPLASHGRRFLAFVVDRALTLGALGALVVFALERSDEIVVFEVALLFLPLTALMIIQLILLRHGKSIGKSLFRIRIVGLSGQVPSFSTLLILRFVIGECLLRAVPFYGLVDSLWVLQDHRRAIHDIIADTYVVDDQDPGPAAF